LYSKIQGAKIPEAKIPGAKIPGVGVLLLAGACAGCGGDEPAGEVVVGLTSDYRAGVDLFDLEVVREVNGEISSEGFSLGANAGALDFPAELPFTGVEVGDELAMTLTGFDTTGTRVVRRLTTQVVANDKRLLRVHLESACSLATPREGERGAPLCNETSHTCIAGACRESFVPASGHEIYRDDWHQSFADSCKPADAGAPEVIVGYGQSDYLPAADYDVAEVEAGPQGGHHIWVATRIKNLHRSGSITEVGGTIPDLGLDITPLSVIFTMEPDEGGYCKLYGLRFQIDIDGGDVTTMLGKVMKVDVTISDVAHDVGVGERWVTLSDTIR
jgi:hypothetical protein